MPLATRNSDQALLARAAGNLDGAKRSTAAMLRAEHREDARALVTAIPGVPPPDWSERRADCRTGARATGPGAEPFTAHLGSECDACVKFEGGVDREKERVWAGCPWGSGANGMVAVGAREQPREYHSASSSNFGTNPVSWDICSMPRLKLPPKGLSHS